MKKKSIAILGAFGGINIGDEVILESDLALASAAGYQPSVTVLSTGKPVSEALLQDYKSRNVDIIHFKNVGTALQSTWGRDLFIGGGQIIDGSAGAKLALVQLFYAAVSRLSGGKVTIGAAGVYDVSGSLTRTLYGMLFRLCDGISTRDQKSHDALSFSSAYRAKGRCAADVVFSFDVTRFRRPDAARKRIALAVHAAPHVSFMDFEAAQPFLREIVARYGAEYVDILVHDSRPNFDLEFARRLKAGFDEEDSPAIVTFDTVKECLGYYQTVQTVVSARMHPLIIGAISGANCVPLKGSSKVSEFARLGELDLISLYGTDEAAEAVANARPVSKRILQDLAEKARTCLT